jgi:hypothetical protein
MKEYDKEKPLISLHIPKCSGNSFRNVLKEWFGENLYKHYFQQYNAMPLKHDLKPGICIHGHFNKKKGFGVMDYYPEIDQFITLLRDPFQIAVSRYFFWKRKGRYNRIRRGALKEGDDHDYINIDDFFKKRPKSHVLNFMPYEITMDNYEEILESKFVYVGIVEDLNVSINMMAKHLGFPPVKIGHLNVSERDEEPSKGVKEEFINNNQPEYAVYNYVLTKYKQ